MMEPSPQASASELPTWIEYGEPIAVIVAAVATVAAAVYAYFQYRAARQTRRDALDAQKDAARAHEATEKARKQATWPYVVASPVPELTDEQHLALLFKNYGQTMAHDVRFTVVSEWVLVPPRRNEVLAGAEARMRSLCRPHCWLLDSRLSKRSSSREDTKLAHSGRSSFASSTSGRTATPTSMSTR